MEVGIHFAADEPSSDSRRQPVLYRLLKLPLQPEQDIPPPVTAGI
jgi:hypothetical protein